MNDKIIRQLEGIKVPTLDGILSDAEIDRVNSNQISLEEKSNLIIYESTLRKRLEGMMQNIYTLRNKIIETFDLYREEKIYKKDSNRLPNIFFNPKKVLLCKSLPDSKEDYQYGGDIVWNKGDLFNKPTINCIADVREKNYNGELKVIFDCNSEKIIKFCLWTPKLLSTDRIVMDSPQSFIEEIVKDNLFYLKNNQEGHLNSIPFLLNEFPNWYKYMNKNLEMELAQRNNLISSSEERLNGLKKIDFED